MAGSSYGTIFKITTWGESHGAALGVTIDGCPSGIELSETDIQMLLDRRKPGQNKFTTSRKEGDVVEILSGVFNGKTLGTPISLLVRNTNQNSSHYDSLSTVYRPGHADYTFDKKYGLRDYRGGGRSSGRETIGRVASGAIALKILHSLGIKLSTYVTQIGPISIPPNEYQLSDISTNPLLMPNEKHAKEAQVFLEACIKNQDSAGGTIECIATGMPIGVGDTVFEKLDANLAKGLMSIGSVKAVEIGDGTAVSSSVGSTNNDAFCMTERGIEKVTNHSGGILGGMSDGSPIVTRVSIKPTPSISVMQQTVNENGESVELSIHGRHDPIIVPRAVVVVESMVALTLVDAIFLNMSSNIDTVKRIYQRED